MSGTGTDTCPRAPMVLLSLTPTSHFLSVGKKYHTQMDAESNSISNQKKKNDKTKRKQNTEKKKRKQKKPESDEWLGSKESRWRLHKVDFPQGQKCFRQKQVPKPVGVHVQTTWRPKHSCHKKNPIKTKQTK